MLWRTIVTDHRCIQFLLTSPSGGDCATVEVEAGLMKQFKWINILFMDGK